MKQSVHGALLAFSVVTNATTSSRNGVSVGISVQAVSMSVA